MKKITKTLTASVLAVAASAGVFSAIPASHVAYADPVTPTVSAGDVISATKLPTTGTVGRDVEIPVATAIALGGAATGNAVSVVVTRPDGRAQAVSENKPSGTLLNWYFKPTVAGTYKLQYQVTNTTSGVTTLSEVFHIKVTADTYTMTIDENSDIILPSIVDTNAERFVGGKVKSVVLPNPVVKNEAGYVVYEDGAVNPIFAEYKGLPALIAAASGGEKTALEARYTEIAEIFEEHDIDSDDVDAFVGGSLEITVTTESKTLSSVGVDASALVKSGDNYVFTPEQGTNVVHYVYKAANGANLQSLTKTIVGSDTYNHKTIKLGWTAANRPTSARINERVDLPLASGFNKSDANSAVTVRTDIKVTKVGGDGTNLVERDEEGYYFIPTLADGEKSADFEITYNVEDYYGNKGTAYSYTLEKVKDGSAPTMYIVDAFDYDKLADATTDTYRGFADAVIGMENAEYSIPTKIERFKDGTSTANIITFPAFFAEDAVVGYKNLVFYRSITSNEISGSVNLLSENLVLKDGEAIDDVKNMSQAEQASHAASINLNELNSDSTKKYPAGDYTVTYTVRDGNGYSATKSFTFTIVEAFADSEAPTVTYGDQFPTLVNDGQDVSFAVPTISDNVDANPRVRYYVSAGAFTQRIYAKDKVVSFNMSDDMEDAAMTIYEAAIANGNKITIKTEVVDDYGKTTTETVDIAVRNTNDMTPIEVRASVASDFAANALPTITNTYVQGSTVTVAGVTFEDNDPNLTIIVTVRDDQGNKVYGTRAIGAIEKTTAGGVTTYTHPGIKSDSAKAISYTVTYTAVDAGNNIVAYTVKLPALADNEAPIISGVTTGKVYEIELGEKLDLGRVTVLDNVDEGLTPTLACEAHPEFINGTIFAPTEAGTFTVVYNAKDNNGNDAETVSIEVKVTDTTAPTLTINNKEKYGTTVKHESQVIKNFSKVELPSFSAEDDTYDFGLDAGALNMYAKATIKIAAPDGNTYTVDHKESKYLISYDEINDVYSFVPTTKGTYTVTYSAVDAAGNKAEDYVITVMVGDTVLPSVNYTESIAANIKVGDVIYINEDKVKVTDKGFVADPDKPNEKPEWSSIVIEDASGKKVEFDYTNDAETIRKYVFDKAGVYTLTIVGRDVAGNTNTYTQKINVTANASSTSIKDNVTGVVLIVVSLLILAGVIIYFAKGKKRVSAKKTVKKVTKKETTEEKED